MTSTRNNNTPGNYAMEQRENRMNEQYKNYAHSQHGMAYRNETPAVGILHGQMPRETLSKNPIEIESMLFGNNSTNLVNPQKPPTPKLKTLPERKFFERPTLIMPKPLVVEAKQRPLPMA